MTDAAIEPTVIAVLADIARVHRPDLSQLSAETRLVDDLEFDSLDLAQAVAELESRTGIDPFARHVTIGSVRTVGDFVAAYRTAAADRPSGG
jgi:acyl carrier protein